jgi:hypothetical protein
LFPFDPSIGLQIYLGSKLTCPSELARDRDPGYPLKTTPFCSLQSPRSALHDTLLQGAGDRVNFTKILNLLHFLTFTKLDLNLLKKQGILTFIRKEYGNLENIERNAYGVAALTAELFRSSRKLLDF